MKTLLLSFILTLSLSVAGQITTPIIKSGFGVDADLRSNFFNGFLSNGNDDWFPYPGVLGTGAYVIDTTGASAVLAGYASDVSPWLKRMSSIYRGMSRPAFTVVNNRLWLDALFVRDYHATDTTVFTSGSDKNGMSPASWTGGVQGIPDKNDILDIYMHVRRAGPTTTDSLWLFGGISLDNTTGNRYFDFEMYQTDIYYDRASGKWFGYGPDAGHTSWQFDAAGNITRPGDIIFSAEYQSSTLTNVEARIWIDKASLSTTPAAFTWSGQFDGASSGAQYGYASIMPKTSGAFYTGLGSGTNTWSGAFRVVLQDNTVSTTYAKDQFMEFSVNLTKLGLDPVTTFGTDVCGTPFNRLVVKTRSSSSFTAELKDFVAPTDLFLAPRVDALADVPMFCGAITGSNIMVTNPSSASVYSWSTIGGNILGSTSGTTITVDAPGAYIVTQRLSAACNPYATDTVLITFDAGCNPLPAVLQNFKGVLRDKKGVISWNCNANEIMEYFEIQRSTDGQNFETIQKMMATDAAGMEYYSYEDDLSNLNSNTVQYRLRVKRTGNIVQYTRIVQLQLPLLAGSVSLYPNPARKYTQLDIVSLAKAEARIMVYNFSGNCIFDKKLELQTGRNVFTLDQIAKWPTGVYTVQIKTGEKSEWQKLIVTQTAMVKE